LHWQPFDAAALQEMQNLVCALAGCAAGVAGLPLSLFDVKWMDYWSHSQR